MATAEPGLLQAEDAFAPQGQRVLRRLVQDRSAVVGMVIVGIFVLAAVTAPWLAPHDPVQTDFTNRYASPSLDHPFGTDNVGRDVFSRILWGGRLSLGMAVSATLGITLLGLTLGLLSAMYGRLAETVVMRITDVLQALPTLILALVLVGLLGQGLRNLIIVVALIGWPLYARIVRGMALKVREREFVEAARAVGASRLRIIVRHVVPNLVGPMVVLSTLDMGRVLLTVSGLSFLGFGVAPPTPEWGAMLSEARNSLDRAPQLLAYPGLAITLVVLAFNLAGDGLRDFLDPRAAAEVTAGRRRRRLTRRRPPAPLHGAGAPPPSS